MDDNSIINDLTQGSVARRLIKFSLPFMLSNFLQTAHSLVDMIVVGRFIGEVGMSAVAVAAQLMSLIMLVCMGFSNGGQVMIAQKVGSGQRDKLRQSIGTMSTVMLLSAVVISIAGLPLRSVLLKLLSTPAEAFSQATGYLTVVFAGTVFIYGYNLTSAIFRGCGDSKHPLLFVFISTVVNIMLDYLFVGPLHWGAVGAAAATIIGYATAFIISVVYLYVHRGDIGFDFKLSSFRPVGEAVRELVRLGLPLGIEMGIISISMLVVNKFVNQYGVTASAVFGAGAKVDEFSFIVGGGIMMANTTMVAQNTGAGKQDRAIKSVHTSELILVVTTALLVTVFALFPKQVYSVFTKDPSVIEMAPMFMKVLAMCTPATLIMAAYQSFIEGIGNSRLAMCLAFLDGFIGRLSISFICANTLGMGLQGYFYGYGMAAYIYFILGGIYFYSGVWKKKYGVAPLSNKAE